MSDVVIVTDGNSGLTREEAAKFGIGVVPMPVLINGKTYYEGENLTREQFFHFLEEDADVSTSQPSPGTVTDVWDAYLKEYDEVVYIPMSSGLSESYATARMLAQDYDGKVQVVDSKRVSTPMYQQLLDALSLVKQGKNAAQIREELDRRAEDFSVYVTVDSLKYLKKGGRISATSAVVGTMLHIKPVLRLGGGKVDVAAKCRGFKAARHTMFDLLREDLDGRLKEYRDQGKIQFVTAYAGVSKETVEEWHQQIRETFQVDHIVGAPLSLSLTCHWGPGVFGIGAVGIAG